VRADRDAYARVIEKTQCTPWRPPSDYSVYPAPNSRLYDPSCIEDPCLPTPSPQLYNYELPALPPRDNDRFKPSATADADSMIDSMQQQQDLPTEATPPVPFDNIEEQQPPAPTPDGFTENGDTSNFSHVAYQPVGDADEDGYVARLEDLAPLEHETSATFLPLDSPVLYDQPVVEVAIQVPPDEANSDFNDESDEPEGESIDDAVRTQLIPIPKSDWEQIPNDCLTRMLEFPSVRAEYKSTYGRVPEENSEDDAPKLALEDIIDLTLLNSRELQTQKELLYRTALTLTLERFDYQLRPSVGSNNGTAATYTHDRFERNTDDRLQIPTSAQLEKMLYTGGDFLGRFANSVLLNFNGPEGFTANVSSELLFSLSQSLLQRDVRLENLTQAERDVVYAARDFTRFRRELFVQQASDYYSLIRQFRQVEINCQNYFTLAREFNQRSVEIRVNVVGVTRTQLDQVEQQVINGRQSILSTCTNLENALDSLKIRMGIPTEQPLDIDLSELNLLTLRDELAVNAELIARSRKRILQVRQSESRDASVIVGGMTLLVETMRDAIELRKRLGDESPDAAQLASTLLGLRIEDSEFEVFEYTLSLQQELDGDRDATKVIQRRRDVIGSLLTKADLQTQLLEQIEDDEGSNQERTILLEQLTNRMEQLEFDLRDYIDRLNSNRVGPATPGQNENAEAQLLDFTQTLQDELAEFTDELDTKIGRTTPDSVEAFDRRAMELSDQLLSDSQPFLDTMGAGLVPIEIEMDDAMMTALVQRFDLMNERGLLADDWREIKYAADDLRSVLNLEASQRIRTRNGENRPFDFTFDDSTTTAGVTLDLPFNRRAQRNQYRASLFNYQSALRNIMQLEDNIKLSVRRDVRVLKLDRQQYANDVAGAALASERVTGTELEVRNGDATSRDFLESQTAYVQAVSNVASRHINYIVGRLQLFLDLESLDVGDSGFWDKLYDENYQPEANYGLTGYEPAYGRLHPKLKYSKRIQRMRCVPDGQAMIHTYEESAEVLGTE